MLTSRFNLLLFINRRVSAPNFYKLKNFKQNMKIKKQTLTFLIVAAIIILGIFMVTTNAGTKVKLETNQGDIVIQLYSNEMPITTGNFQKLVEQGFYDGVIFHRIIDGFMIQGGDPQGTGEGGPGYNIQDEFTEGDLDKNDRGTISMANAGPNTGGSQFFINLVNNNYLDGKHPVFGKVVEGMDVVDSIAKVATDSQSRPVEEVKIISASIL